MRLWTLHPRYLDSRGLVALWREGLLAQKVLAGETKGYRRHPQLARFRATADPPTAIASYLAGVLDEARARGYDFNASRIATSPSRALVMPATEGQLRYEWSHLLGKLRDRNPDWCLDFPETCDPDPHPLFWVGPGGVEAWERA